MPSLRSSKAYKNQPNQLGWAGWQEALPGTRCNAKKVVQPIMRGLAKSLLLSLPSNHMTVSSKSVAIPTTVAIRSWACYQKFETSLHAFQKELIWSLSIFLFLHTLCVVGGSRRSSQYKSSAWQCKVCLQSKSLWLDDTPSNVDDLSSE